MGGARVVGVALGLAAAWPATASGWERPIQVSATGGPRPYVSIDRHGTTRVFGWAKVGRYHVLSLRRGSRRVHRCRLRGTYDEISVLDVEDYRLGIAVNDAGGMVLGVTSGFKLPRVRVATAAPGRCFNSPRVMSPRTRVGNVGQVAIGPHGTALATWLERDRKGRTQERYAAAPAGARMPPGRRLPKPRARGVAYGPRPAFFGRDRVLWQDTVAKNLGEGRYLYREFAAASRPGAGRIGSYHEVARTDKYYEQVAGALTDSHGGQVSGVYDDRGHLLLRSRGLGRPFGPVRAIDISDFREGGSSGINARGDAVFAWTTSTAQLFVLIRRHDGTLIGPQAITPIDGAGEVVEPVAAIDAAGRAIVVWRAQHGTREQLTPGEVQAAVSDRRGRFGPVHRVSGTKRLIYDSLAVDVNDAGRAAILFYRLKLRQVGIVGEYAMVVRTRLGR